MEGGVEEDRPFSYPIRPGEPECDFFLRTGHCSFGTRCKFHHPPEKAEIKYTVEGYPIRPVRVYVVVGCGFVYVAIWTGRAANEREHYRQTLARRAICERRVLLDGRCLL
eukprot:6128812-Pyramimonas_sp.AAC.3